MESGWLHSLFLMDFTLGLIITLIICIDFSAIALWQAGPRKQSVQRRWARKLWSINTFVIRYAFLAWLAGLIAR